MPLVPDLSDNELLVQLRASHNRSYEMLYRRCYPSIEHFVLQNKGSKEQAHDLFQDALLAFMTNLCDPSFVLTSSLKTYLFAISRNLWLKQLSHATRLTDLDAADEPAVAPIEPDTPPTAYETAMSIMMKLTVRCMKLLSAVFFQRKAMETIVKEEGYANLHTAQNQKYKCLQQARKVGRNSTG